MAKVKAEDEFIRKATVLGLKQMLSDVEELLRTELTTTQRIFTEEMKGQIEKHLEELNK